MDCIFRNALVHDGLGHAPVMRDVAVRDGRITAVAPQITADAGVDVDLGGLALAPGFIDVHGHSDGSLITNPAMASKVRQGVTTEVIGNCGFSAAPLDERIQENYAGDLAPYNLRVDWDDMASYMARVEVARPTINCVPLVGHNNLRAVAVGYDDVRATPTQMQRMEALVLDAMRAGAWGVSSGLIYIPSCYGDVEELSTLAAVAARHGGLYASHIRSESEFLEAAVAEAIEVGDRSGALVEVSHHKASGLGTWGKVETTLRMMDEARARGVRVFCDQYPYTASSTGLDAVLPQWALEGGRPATTERLRDPSCRARIAAVLRNHRYGDWTRVQIAAVGRTDGANVAFVGHHVQWIADHTGKSPEDAVMDLLYDEKCDVAAIYFSMCDEDVERVMRDPHTIVGSDSVTPDVNRPDLTGRPHPRTFGTFPRVLGTYVRDRGVLDLPTAIHRMTGQSAHRFGITDRGVIGEGCFADLVVFDPVMVADTATFDDPLKFPVGIPHVMVNGRFVLRDGRPTDARPGRVLRRPTDGVPVP